jgi:hypothetical protein
MTPDQREVLQELADGAVLTVLSRREATRIAICDLTGAPVAPVRISTFQALEGHGWVEARHETVRHPAVGAERSDYVEQTFEITSSGLDALHEARLR